MHTADVLFSRIHDGVEMTLSINHVAVARSISPESIVRELQIRGVRELRMEDGLVMELPTSVKTLELAAGFAWREPLAALKLIAACAHLGDVAIFPYPERRAKPRAEATAVGGVFP